MCVQAISRFFQLGIDDWQPQGVEPPANPVIELDGKNQTEQMVLAKAILSTYEIESDDSALRNNTRLFEKLRGDYPDRREFGNYSIRATNIDVETLGILRKTGFNILQD